MRISFDGYAKIPAEALDSERLERLKDELQDYLIVCLEEFQWDLNSGEEWEQDTYVSVY